MNLTPYQIAEATKRYSGRENTAAINRVFRAVDKSHLWPICNRFNATERAIKRTRKAFMECGNTCEGLEYILALETELGHIILAAIR